MEKLTFKQLTRNILKNRFGLGLINEHKIITDWIEKSKKQTITDFEEHSLKLLRKNLNLRSSAWNEFELSEWFIGPVLSLLEYDTEDITMFANREIGAIVKDCELSGKPDVMIATGFDEPISPYFCFHEYKQQTDPNGNPQTQLLGAMLTAQVLNNNEKTVYGVYVIGMDWQFVILNGNEWSESKRYIADDEEIFDIFRMLKALKEIILSYE
jgi:hypothetical protein